MRNLRPPNKFEKSGGSQVASTAAGARVQRCTAFMEPPGSTGGRKKRGRRNITSGWGGSPKNNCAILILVLPGPLVVESLSMQIYTHVHDYFQSYKVDNWFMILWVIFSSRSSVTSKGA